MTKIVVSNLLLLMRSTHVANLSQQKGLKQISDIRKDVCAAALVFFQDKMNHTVNNLLRRNLETPASMTEQHQHVNANLHLS